MTPRRSTPGPWTSLKRICTPSRTPTMRHPALWHDKTLYAPAAVIDAEVLAAQEMLRARRAAACTEADTERTHA